MAVKAGPRIALTLLIGFLGAAVAAYAGLPAAALLGSALAVSIASLFRLTAAIPAWLRAIAFSIIGCSLGSSVTRDFVTQAAHWPLSLAILTVAVITIMAVCSLVLMKFFQQSAETAILSTSPGALSYLLAIAGAGVGDVRAVIVIQSIRVLLIITILPFMLEWLSGQDRSAPVGVEIEYLGPLAFAALFLLTLAAGWAFERVRVPAAYLLTGTVISGLAHYLGQVSGRPPDGVLFAGFTVTGAIIGSRFSTLPREDLRRLVKASLTLLLISMTLAAAFAALVAQLLSMSFGQVFVAFAPGGIEAMAAMALALGYDPTYVAVHHLYRIMLLILLLPLFLRLIKKFAAHWA